MVVKDYYKILGFENNKASIDEIKIAYRELAKKRFEEEEEAEKLKKSLHLEDQRNSALIPALPEWLLKSPSGD